MKKRSVIALHIFDKATVFFCVFLPFLWFFRRLPDTPQDPHLTWHILWWLAPLLFAAARRIIQMDMAESGQPIPAGWLGKLWIKRLCLAISIPFFLLSLSDEILKQAGYVYEKLPAIVFESDEPEEDVGEKRVLNDPVVLFKFNPGTRYNKRVINSLGYREREVDPVKTENGVRVICFGDSITAQGHPGYSGILNNMLQKAPITDQEWEAFNMAVYGYTSRQGLAVFLHEGLPLKPDYITVFFGINDRNLYDIPDRDRMGKRLPDWKAYLLQQVQDLKIGQLASELTQTYRQKKNRVANSKKVPRVPPDDYVYVLTRFIEEARKHDCTPILITAPRRELFHTSVKKGHAITLEALTERHDHYNNLVRQVAKEQDAPLIDLAKMLEGPEYDHFFCYDGVHFDNYPSEGRQISTNQPGLTFIAQTIYDKLEELAAE